LSRSILRAMLTRILLIVAIAAFAGATLVPLVPATSAATAQFHLPIPWTGGDAPCPSGYSPTTDCHPHPGGPVAVPGFGFVSYSYTFAVELEPGPPCPSGFQKPLSYPAKLMVKGRGDILVTVAGTDRCEEAGAPLLSLAQTFTITGGTGVFAGASGGGVVSRTGATCCPGHATDTWDGTITAAAFKVDATPPTISGAVNKVVRAPRYRVVRLSPRKTKRVSVTSVRVKYKLTAVDDVDGAVPVTCTPTSGSRFRVGRRTVVHCSATDTSANTATTDFTVTVNRR
jgi:hypothetical protein